MAETSAESVGAIRNFEHNYTPGTQRGRSFSGHF